MEEWYISSMVDCVKYLAIQPEYFALQRCCRYFYPSHFHKRILLTVKKEFLALLKKIERDEVKNL